MEFFAIIFPVLVISIMVIGTFFSLKEMCDDRLAERLLVRKLSEDPAVLNEINQEPVVRLINYEMSKSECDGVADEIRRLDGLIMEQMRQLDPSSRRFIAIALGENWRIARERNVLRLARAARKRALQAAT